MGQVVSEIGDYFNAVAVLALIMEQTGSGMVVSLRLSLARHPVRARRARSPASCSTASAASTS